MGCSIEQKGRGEHGGQNRLICTENLSCICRIIEELFFKSQIKSDIIRPKMAGPSQAPLADAHLCLRGEQLKCAL